MLDLVKNQYLQQGKCWYEDEYNNSFFFSRKEDGFVGKVRFSNKDVTADPLYVTVPINPDTEGDTLRLNYPSNVSIDMDKSIQSGIDNFTNLVQRWISMLLDIKTTETPDPILFEFIKDENPDYDFSNWDSENISYYKYNLLVQYEELAEIIAITDNMSTKQESVDNKELKVRDVLNKLVNNPSKLEQE